MKPHPLVLAALACIALTACNKPQTPAPSPVAKTAPAPAEKAPPADTLAGTFTGVIPCADCPGIEATLTFTADGRYTQLMTYQERDSYYGSQGSWVREEDGRIQLEPETKGENVSWLQVLSPTEIRMLDAEGKPIASEFNYTLTRKQG